MANSLRMLALVGAILVGASTAQAQRAERDPEPRQGREATAAPDSASIDKYIVTCLTNGNRAEIALAKIAQERASNKDIRAFAERMVKDHGEMLAKLQRLEGRDRDSTETERGTTSRAAPRDSVSTLMQIDEEIAEQCLASARKELESKKGEEFDKCYIGMQVGAHMKMVTALNVLKQHTKGDLQETISNGAETAGEHLAMAKKLLKNLEAGDSTARRDLETAPK